MDRLTMNRLTSKQKDVIQSAGVKGEAATGIFLRTAVLHYAESKGFKAGSEDGGEWLEQTMPGAFDPLKDGEKHFFDACRPRLTELFRTEAKENIFCGVEELGLFYQALIRDEKARIYKGVRKSRKIRPGEMPAATQLFTPDWIASYMAENTVGAWWLGIRPDSSLRGSMRYFVKNGAREPSPFTLQEMKVLDPACGSGQLLLKVFDILFAVYEETGAARGEIPRLILENHLYGLDIDAGILQLAKASLLLRSRELSGVFPACVDFKNIQQVDPAAHGSLCEAGTVLASHFPIVLANPPYMGTKGMPGDLSTYLKEAYPDTRYDLYAAFMERVFRLTSSGGWSACLAQQSWMYLKSYERLREQVLTSRQTSSFLHLGTGTFETISGEVVQTAAWVMRAVPPSPGKVPFFDLTAGKTAQAKEAAFLAGNGRIDCDPALFQRLPGSVFSYRASPEVTKAFDRFLPLKDTAFVRKGMFTGDNGAFLRKWYEVPAHELNRSAHSITDAFESGSCWFPVKKGGPFRRWSGHCEWVIRLDRKSYDAIQANRGHRSPHFYFQPAITWSKVTTKDLSCRYTPAGSVVNDACLAVYEKSVPLLYLTGLLNSSAANLLLRSYSSSLNYSGGDLGKLPVVVPAHRDREQVERLVRENISLTLWEERWQETSMTFTEHPVRRYRAASLEESYHLYAQEVLQKRKKLSANEEALNRFFAEAYGLTGHVQVHPEEKTLSIRPPCPRRFARSFLSYAVGTAFGRWAEPGKKQTERTCLTEEAFMRTAEAILLAQGFGIAESFDWLAAHLTTRKNVPAEAAVRMYMRERFFRDHQQEYGKRPLYWPVWEKGRLIWFYYPGLRGTRETKLLEDGCPPHLAIRVNGLVDQDAHSIPEAYERFNRALSRAEGVNV
ncbi:hypothetical protein CR205_14225 [Alteribacter lacisalsi]|uniref:site-specific DNA-methyltransferase (adenine-specific) n=1 Tax=Alteribacter lacisalsi TaxID=2045244 RepID=A0A2W0HIL8_9BACI|nr:N-6 DNA methylase [Alteribacter lacisalsi]PYZ96832.1 hypothetical protein CR205_14225 [Alteribacter lacisalsi]